MECPYIDKVDTKLMDYCLLANNIMNNPNVLDPNNKKYVDIAMNTCCALMLDDNRFNIRAGNTSNEGRKICRDKWMEKNKDWIKKNKLTPCKSGKVNPYETGGRYGNINPIINSSFSVSNKLDIDDGGRKDCCYRNDAYITSMKLGVSGKNPANSSKDCSWSVGVL